MKEEVEPQAFICYLQEDGSASGARGQGSPTLFMLPCPCWFQARPPALQNPFPERMPLLPQSCHSPTGEQ